MSRTRQTCFQCFLDGRYGRVAFTTDGSALKPLIKVVEEMIQVAETYAGHAATDFIQTADPPSAHRVVARQTFSNRTRHQST